MAEPTRGAAQSQRSEVVFNSTRDLLPRSWIWVPEHRRYSHPLRFIPTPSAKELGITFRTGIGIAYVTTIRNWHSETVDKALVSRNSVPGQKFTPERVSDSLDYANRWKSQHAEPPSDSDRKSCSSRREISFLGRGYGSDSLDYANRWRSPHAEPPSDSDRKSCSTRREISNPRSWIWVPEHRRYSHPLPFISTPSAKELGITFRTGIGIAYVTTIRNRHSEKVVKVLVLRNSIPRPKFSPERVSYSLDYANRWRSPHTEPPSDSDRKSCSTLREISSPAKELGITFRTGIGIAYVTTIRNRHSKTVDKALVLRNSIPRPKFPPDCVSDSLDYANRWRSPHAEPPSDSDRKSCTTRREISNTRSWIWVPEHRRYSHPLRFIPTPSAKELGITFRTGIRIAYVTTIWNRHSKTVDKALDFQNSVPGPKFPPERVSDSLDYANHWRSPHAEPPSDSDRKSCSTRCEISSPGRGYGCPNIADITVDKALVLRNSVPGPKFPPERVDSLDYVNRWRSPHAEPPSDSDRKSCSTRCEISSPAKELGITFRTGIGIAYVTTIRNRHSETVDKALISRNSVLRPKFSPERRLPDYANRWRSPHTEPPSDSYRKSFSTRREISSPGRGYGCPNIADINRHSETVDKALVLRNSVPGPKFPPERVSDSLDYANRWRSPHAEPPSDSDRKSCSTRCEISSPVDKALVSQNSVPRPKFPAERVSDSLDYANRWRSPHAEPPSDSDRESCSTRREISSPGRGYGCPNIADITVDKALILRNSVPRPKFPPERVSDTLDYANRWWSPHAEPPSDSDRKSCSTRPEISNPRSWIWNRHSETVDKALVLRNSVPGPQFPPERVSVSLDYANRWRSPHAEPPSDSDRKSCSTRREISSPAKEFGITFRTGIGIAYVTTIRNRHSETVDKVLVLRNSVPGQKFPPERVY
ncbi:hypothetical protein Taro_036797 [Colocasia esculenta]|uniref:Uncharacterized protein n=1 Tax=Colocasia esculenta TaxID=4460 RepID=A0A843WAV6_COLES|nr:hypothetical protein [Colocasia esculenta]